MKREEAMKLVENGIAALNEALRAGRSETLERFLETLAKFHHYSFNNALLIALQRPDATRVAGFHVWRKFKRFVKKGENGIAIMAPMSRCQSRDEGDSTTGDRKEAVFGFRVAYVFDVTQTEGEPLPAFAQLNGDATGWLNHLEDAVRAEGVTLEYEHIDFPLGAKGISLPGAIMVAPNLPDSEKFAVLAHEFAHELLHQRPDRKKGMSKQVLETEAEAVAYTVCRAFGIDSTTRSADYIQLYRGTEETLRESLGCVQQTAARVIQMVRRQSECRDEPCTAMLAA